MSISVTMTQVSCFVSDDNGHIYMREYDKLPFDARKRLQNCKYNLCGACLKFYAGMFRNIHSAITYMEGMVDGHDMNSYFEEATYKAQYQPDWRSIQYIPEYWDDREIDVKIKRDWYTQRMEQKNYEYMRLMEMPTRLIKPTDYF